MALSERLDPIGIEQRRGGGAFDQRGRPGGVVALEPALQPVVAALEPAALFGTAFGVGLLGIAQVLGHHGLHRRHHVVVKDPVEQA